MRHGRLLVASVILLLACAACDGSDPDDNNPTDDFTATINGGSTFGGTAFAVETRTSGSGDVSWGITMNDTETGYQILIAWESARPSNGPYPISDTNPAAFEVIAIFEDVLDQYVGKSGTLTITSSSDSEVRGQLNFMADYNGLETGSMGNSISVSLDFTANNIVDTD